MEETPHSVFQHEAIYPFLYGKDDKQFERYMTTQVPFLKSLLKKKEDYWVALLKKYDIVFVILNHHIYI